MLVSQGCGPVSSLRSRTTPPLPNIVVPPFLFVPGPARQPDSAPMHDLALLPERPGRNGATPSLGFGRAPLSSMPGFVGATRLLPGLK